MVSHRSRLVRSCVVAAALIAGEVACSNEEPRTASAEMQPESFTFSPPEGTRGVRTERRRYEVSLVGAPLRNLEEEELRWNVSFSRSGDTYAINQELAHVTMKTDGETIVDADVKRGAVTAQLVIDREGNLIDVRGLEGTSRTLRSLAKPQNAELADKVFSTQRLKTMVAMRYEETYGDIIGRSTRVGSSWTTQGRAGSPVLSRTMTVERTEPCGSQTCARLRATYKLDPKAITDIASALVRSDLKAAGMPKGEVTMKNAMYSMEGEITTEPATLVSHHAALNENGSVLLAGPKGERTVNLNGKTEIDFDYQRGVASAGGAATETAAAR